MRTPQLQSPTRHALWISSNHDRTIYIYKEKPYRADGKNLGLSLATRRTDLVLHELTAA